MIGITTILGGLAKAAGAIAAKAEQGQLIDAGEARGHANRLEALYAKLEEMRGSRDRIDSDPEFDRWVLEQIRRDD